MYVLTDDNPPAVEEIRANGAYVACLLSIARSQTEDAKTNGEAKDPADDREVTLRVLCAGVMKNIAPVPPPSIAATVDIDRDIVLSTLQPVLVSTSLPEISQQAETLIVQAKSEEVGVQTVDHCLPYSDCTLITRRLYHPCRNCH